MSLANGAHSQTTPKRSTTMALDEVARRHGVRLERTPVGEANVVARMLEIGAVVGGEGNGGVILPSLHPGRDALLGVALVLAAVARHGSLSACLQRLPPAYMQKEKLDLIPSLDSPALWERALAQMGQGGSLDRRDGLKYALADRWIHLRRSNTEPTMVTPRAAAALASASVVGPGTGSASSNSASSSRWQK